MQRIEKSGMQSVNDDKHIMLDGFHMPELKRHDASNLSFTRLDIFFLLIGQLG